jgi:hypothetical protein
MTNELSKEEAELREELLRHLMKGPDECEHIISTIKNPSADVRSVLQHMLIAGDIKADQLMDDVVLTDQSQITFVDK